MTLRVHTLPILGDHKNYAYIIETGHGENALIDPGESDTIITYCVDKNIHITHILLTHHHWDHVNGAAKIAKYFDASTIAPDTEKEKIKHWDTTVKNQDTLNIGPYEVHIIALPGHTLGHIGYYIPDTKMLFCGDVLFGGGCGKIFEGTRANMWNTLQKILALPEDTKIYFGHEYTQSNLEFGITIEPNNHALRERLEKTRTDKTSTTPTTLKLEKKTNIFLRAKTLSRFTELRTQKDKA